MKNILSKKIGRSGQMAIFVALIFQVLFLFFAMTINVGLVVHDKINLQNAVDISAYYVAQRQAEMLNVIAHTNYQVRQAWKLLNWRAYVLGTMGRQNPNWAPANPQSPFGRADALDPGAQFPTVCVTYNPTWVNIGNNDTVCKSDNFSAPNIRVPTVVAPFLPFNILFNRVASQLQERIAQTCNSYSGINWWYASTIYVAYMLDQANRKEIMRALARNLARPPESMIDLSGDSVSAGAQKTFLKNLTRTNRESVEEFKILNPMQGIEPNKWLKEIDIFFTLFYSEVNGTSTTCNSVQKQFTDLPGSGDWRQQLTGVFGSDNIANLEQYVEYSKGVNAGDPRQVSLGVEKNPWYMVYAGVKAKTRPRQVFLPFGQPVQFEAKAYAQPFGGRIGPWYGRMWSRGAEESEGDPVQASPAKLLAGGFLNSQEARNLVPRFSRYPGDQLGYSSRLAQAAFKSQLAGSNGGIVARHVDYAGIISDFGPGGANDPLPYAPDNATTVRDYEISAIAPDLFDVTYYSVEPNFGQVYLERLRRFRRDLGIPDNVYPRGDLGARDPDATQFSVKDQIDVTKAGTQARVNMVENDVFWIIRDRPHLLTGWVHNDKFGDYTEFPEKRFGVCQETDDNFRVKVPGSCLQLGGRTGYSVKIVSGDYLRSSIPLGGSSQSAGTILNPPPENW